MGYKPLFTKEWETYTEEAGKLDNKARKLLEPLMKDYIVEKGFSPKDVSYILQNAVTAIEVVTHARHNIETRKRDQDGKKKDNL